MTDSTIISKIWNLASVLRDDGVGYGDYLEQITYLLFLKMADELNKPPYNKGLNFPRLKDVEGNEIPDSWIKNQKEVNVMALGEGYTTHDVAWLDVKGGGRILPLPNVVYRISKPLPNGMVYLRKNKKCSRCAVPLQFVLDYVYQDLKQNHPQQQHIWDKKQRYKWDRQPITSEQISLIHKLAPDYKIDTKKMTRGDASRVIQLLAYAPKEQDAQEQAQEVQDDAT